MRAEKQLRPQTQAHAEQAAELDKSHGGGIAVKTG